jgi:hypothetical protein
MFLNDEWRKNVTFLQQFISEYFWEDKSEGSSYQPTAYSRIRINIFHKSGNR